jgi:RNA polymerase sigma-70 factor (ECF subfamily)
MSDDSGLLVRLRQGRPEAWQAVAELFRQRLRELAAASLPPEVVCRADASDVVQQTFAEANQSIEAFRGTTVSELFAWLTAVLNNNVTDVIRQHILAQRRTVKAECRLDDSSHANVNWSGMYIADQTPPSLVADRVEAHDQLRAALERLPVRQHTAVRLRHLEGRPLADIATELGCSKQAAAAIIARGLRALRAALNAD